MTSSALIARQPAGALAERLLRYGLVAICAIVALFVEPSEPNESVGTFVFLTVLLLAFLAMEIFVSLRQGGVRVLIQPAELASILTFALSYGVTNILFFMPERILEPLGFIPVITPAMTKLMALVTLGSVALWSGYHAGIGARIGASVARAGRALLRRQYQVSLGMVAAFAAVSVACRLIQVQLGVFGYASDFQALFDYAAYREYLDTGAKLGRATLLAVALSYFVDPKRNRRLIGWLVLLVTYEVIVAFLGGFKGQVLVPLALVGMPYLLIRGRFPKVLFAAGGALIVAAYWLIEPAREARHEDPSFDSRSVAYITGTLLTAASTAAGGSDQEAGGPVAIRIMGRSNLTYIGSLGIEYVDANIALPEGSPGFLRDMLMAPLNAWIPRILWESKPLDLLGWWYTTEVIGLDLQAATGMGPVTYLYFAGGVIAVFIGFLVIGVVQRLFWSLVQTGGSGVTFIYLFAIGTLVLIDSGVNGFFTHLFRYVPIYVLLQFLLFKR